jgi:hypothetical protein
MPSFWHSPAIPMSTSPDDQRHLTRRQEKLWFRVSTVVLVLFFAIAGSILSWSQWQAKHEDREIQTQLMDPAAQDPGITAAEETATAAATRVQVGVYVDRIMALSIKDTTWTAVFDLWFRWQGDLGNPGEDFVLMEGNIVSKEKLVEYNDADGHYIRYRVEATFTKPFRVTRFPADDHLLTLALESGGTVRQKLLFVPDEESTRVSSRVSVPGYLVTSSKGIEKAHSYKTTRGDPRLPAGMKSTFSQYRFGITLERAGWGLYLKMFQALYVAVGVALLACFIKPTDVDPRFGLGIGALFAAVANSYLVGSYVPDTGEFTLADVVNAIGILTILATIIESTVSLYLYDRRGEEALSRKLDRVSFSIMLPCFLGVNLLLLIAASA